jgi:hypothetical protein
MDIHTKVAKGAKEIFYHGWARMQTRFDVIPSVAKKLSSVCNLQRFFAAL